MISHWDSSQWRSLGFAVEIARCWGEMDVPRAQAPGVRPDAHPFRRYSLLKPEQIRIMKFRLGGACCPVRTSSLCILTDTVIPVSNEQIFRLIK
jgi:hypothetical protein